MNFDLKVANRAFEDLKWLSCHGTWPDKKYPEWAKEINDQYHTDGIHIVQNVAWPLIADVFRHHFFQMIHALDDVIGYAESECESLYSMDDDPEVKEEAETAAQAVSNANDLLKSSWKAFQ
jgi:hypothetical protein